MEPAGPARVERRLAAILAADVAGYSRLIEADEEGTLSRLKALRAEVIDPRIATHKGRIVKMTGDGLLVEFASVVDALRCAAAVQAAMGESNVSLPPDQRIMFRIGINVGDIVVEAGDIFGDGVNVAARLEGLTIDPGYAPAAGLGAWCILLATVQGWLPPEQRTPQEAARLARQALDSGRDDPDCLWVAAFALMYLGGEHATAASIVDRALSLNPNSAQAWATCGWIHAFCGRANQAIEAFERAIRLSPRDPLAFILFRGGLAFAHMIAGRYEVGLEYVRQGLIEQPRSIALLRIKAALCGHAGRVEEGREAIERLLELYPGLTMAHYMKMASIYIRPEPRAIVAEGLRKAGLPEE